MINVILDLCLEKIRAGRATVAECLARYPDCALELAPLLDMALAIESIPEVRPSGNFKETMRAYLLHLPLHITASSRDRRITWDPNRQPSQVN